MVASLLNPMMRASSHLLRTQQRVPTPTLEICTFSAAGSMFPPAGTASAAAFCFLVKEFLVKEEVIHDLAALPWDTEAIEDASFFTVFSRRSDAVRTPSVPAMSPQPSAESSTLSGIGRALV